MACTILLVTLYRHMVLQVVVTVIAGTCANYGIQQFAATIEPDQILPLKSRFWFIAVYAGFVLASQLLLLYV